MNIKKLLSLRDRSITKGRKLQKKDDLKVIAMLQKQFEIDLKNIRQQERNRYELLLDERNEEIARLHQEAAEQRKYFNHIVNFGILLEQTGNNASGHFKRASEKFKEAIQLIDRGCATIEAGERMMEKQTPNLIKRIR